MTRVGDEHVKYLTPLETTMLERCQKDIADKDISSHTYYWALQYMMLLAEMAVTRKRMGMQP